MRNLSTQRGERERSGRVFCEDRKRGKAQKLKGSKAQRLKSSKAQKLKGSKEGKSSKAQEPRCL
jgi:hypothetical protein